MIYIISNMKEIGVGVAGIMYTTDSKIKFHETTKGVIQMQNW